MIASETSSKSSSLPVPAPKPLRFLIALESFEGNSKSLGPDAPSSILTGLLCILLLISSEQLCLQWLFNNRAIHGLLDDELNRRILARHIGVDTFACIICATLGVLAMKRYKGVWNMYVHGKKEEFPRAAYLNRVLAYDAASFRLCLFFTAYQIKNLYDTIIFDDGPEFIFHHVFSATTAYGCMGPKISNFYPPFFVGLSEISTAILCLLANFDDVHGVKGLSEAMPTTKIVLAVLFVISFIICRVIVWPILSYHFFQDILNTLRHHGDDPRVKKRKGWYIFQLVSNSGLTLLQIAWLFQIFYMAHKELLAMGVL